MSYKFYSKIQKILFWFFKKIVLKWFKKKTKGKKEEEYECKKEKIVKCFKWILHKLRIQFCTLNESLQHRELFNEKWMTPDRKRKKKNLSKSYLCATPYWHWKKKKYHDFLTRLQLPGAPMASCVRTTFKNISLATPNYINTLVWCSCKILDANGVVEADNLKKKNDVLNCFFFPFFYIFYILYISDREIIRFVIFFIYYLFFKVSLYIFYSR